MAASVPRRSGFSGDPRSVAHILMTFGLYPGAGKAPRIVLPLRAVRRTNCRPLAVDLARRLAWLMRPSPRYGL